MAYKIEYYYASSIGKCRKANQDNFSCNGKYMESENQGTGGVKEGVVSVKERPVFGVFDGMGGEERGEMAAFIASKHMAEFSFSKEGSEKGFFDFCSQANRQICQYAEENQVSSMGTTAAILRFEKKKSCLCNIGDSKIFLFDGSNLTQLSYDHVGIAAFGRKPPLTQNLVIPEEEMIIEPYVAAGEYKDGEVYLICSDGITDMLPNQQIQQILTEDPGRTAAEKLLEGALINGGRDNITFILMYVKKKKLSLFGRKKR